MKKVLAILLAIAMIAAMAACAQKAEIGRASCRERV